MNGLAIRLFRFDGKTGEVYILSADELQIIVYRNGEWDFVNEPELSANEFFRVESLCRGKPRRH
ncbi:DUF6888 family protein [uncultured Nostoc sp.]|uniref:DUF6888 family protein n=1 Tax=Nostoc sp. TaxID=1180 RepID=UPI0035C9703D